MVQSRPWLRVFALALAHVFAGCGGEDNEQSAPPRAPEKEEMPTPTTPEESCLELGSTWEWRDGVCRPVEPTPEPTPEEQCAARGSGWEWTNGACVEVEPPAPPSLDTLTGWCDAYRARRLEPPAMETVGGLMRVAKVADGDSCSTFEEQARELEVVLIWPSTLTNSTRIDLRPLLLLPKLTSLDVSLFTILNPELLSELSSLRSFYARKTPDPSIMGTILDELAELSIEILDLSENEIDDLTPFARLTSLRALMLNGNQLTDLSPLSALERLILFYAEKNDPPLNLEDCPIELAEDGDPADFCKF